MMQGAEILLIEENPLRTAEVIRQLEGAFRQPTITYHNTVHALFEPEVLAKSTMAALIGLDGIFDIQFLGTFRLFCPSCVLISLLPSDNPKLIGRSLSCGMVVMVSYEGVQESIVSAIKAASSRRPFIDENLRLATSAYLMLGVDRDIQNKQRMAPQTKQDPLYMGAYNSAGELSKEDAYFRGGPATKCLDVLTNREREVLGLLGRGMTNPEISAELCISCRTTRFHVSSILAKLHLNNRTQAALLISKQEAHSIR